MTAPVTASGRDPVGLTGVPRDASASAPGKLILMGEHSVVYGHPAVAAAVQRRLRVRARPIASATAAAEAVLVLRLPGGRPVTLTWTEAARTAGEAGPGDARSAGDGHYLALVALGTAVDLLGRTPPPLEVLVDSDIPVGHGMGSSAALALSLIAAVCAAAGVDPPSSDLEAAAHEVERRQHGSPSGIDGATVLRGGVIRAEAAEPGARLRFRPLAADPRALAHFRAYDSGCPAHGTGEVVAAVRRRLEADRGLEAELERMGELARGFANGLATGHDPAAVGAAVRSFESALEALGVVPPAATRIIRRVEAEGGAAKVSGAGGLCDGTDGALGAGMILVHHEDPRRIAGWDFLRDIRPVDAAFGGPGLEVA